MDVIVVLVAEKIHLRSPVVFRVQNMSIGAERSTGSCLMLSIR